MSRGACLPLLSGVFTVFRSAQKNKEIQNVSLLPLLVATHAVLACSKALRRSVPTTEVRKDTPVVGNL
jgi:hypothetical protein